MPAPPYFFLLAQKQRMIDKLRDGVDKEVADRLDSLNIPSQGGSGVPFCGRGCSRGYINSGTEISNEQIMEKLEALERKIDLIFKDHILIRGRWYNINLKGGK